MEGGYTRVISSFLYHRAVAWRWQQKKAEFMLPDGWQAGRTMPCWGTLDYAVLVVVPEKRNGSCLLDPVETGQKSLAGVKTKPHGHHERACLLLLKGRSRQFRQDPVTVADPKWLAYSRCKHDTTAIIVTTVTAAGWIRSSWLLLRFFLVVAPLTHAFVPLLVNLLNLCNLTTSISRSSALLC